MVVGPADALERLIFSDGIRNLEVGLSEQLVEWRGPRGTVIRVIEGELSMSSEVVTGLVLDLSRALRDTEEPGGDWAFLASGDSLQIVLERPVDGPPGTEGDVHGWAGSISGAFYGQTSPQRGVKRVHSNRPVVKSRFPGRS